MTRAERLLMQQHRGEWRFEPMPRSDYDSGEQYRDHDDSVYDEKNGGVWYRRKQQEAPSVIGSLVRVAITAAVGYGLYRLFTAEPPAEEVASNG